MKKMKVNKLRTYEGNKNEFKKYNEILKINLMESYYIMIIK